MENERKCLKCVSVVNLIIVVETECKFEISRGTILCLGPHIGTWSFFSVILKGTYV